MGNGRQSASTWTLPFKAIHFLKCLKSLNKAVSLYLKTVMTLPEEERDRLLNRSAPLSVRLSFFAHALRSLLSRREPHRYHHQFTMPLAA